MTIIVVMVMMPMVAHTWQSSSTVLTASGMEQAKPDMDDNYNDDDHIAQDYDHH